MECLGRQKPSIPLLLFSVALIFSLAKAADLINDVCSKSQNPPFCISSLKSDPRSGSADLKGLAKIAIDLSTKSSKSTRALVISLEQKASTPRLKGIYDSCLENYDDTIDNLADATQLLSSGDYLGVGIKASAALDGPDTCDDGFKDAQISEPPQLSDASKKVQNLSDIVIVIANRLRGSVNL